MKVTVSQEDINLASINRDKTNYIPSLCCPIALALKSQFPDYSIRVEVFNLIIDNRRLVTSQDVRKFIRSFDFREIVKPFTFDIEEE